MFIKRRNYYHIVVFMSALIILIFAFCISVNAENLNSEERQETELTDEVFCDETDNINNDSNGDNSEIEFKDAEIEKSDLQDANNSQDNINEETIESQDSGQIPTAEGYWNRNDSGWYFYRSDGTIQKGFCYIGNNKYYFDENDGAMKSGWQKIDNDWYYFGNSNDGSAKKGWLQLGNTWYYLDGNGIMQSGIQQIGNGKFYLGDENDGAMKSGWQEIDNDWYYFGNSNDGSAKKGWLQLGNTWYYLDQDYIMVKDTIKEISGSKYAFDASGAMLLGSFKIDGEIYNTYPGGAIKDSGWIIYNNNWYYKQKNGECVRNSMLTISSSKYIFDENGVMKSGWQEIDNDWYYFGKPNDGSAKKGWLQLGNTWYYLDQDYIMVKDTIKGISGNKYAFDASGAMLLGRISYKGKDYVTSQYGSLIRDAWANVGGYWYYASSNMEIYKNRIAMIGNYYYGFDPYGKMFKGKFSMNQITYVTDVSGAAIVYDSSVEAKAREVAAGFGYDLYKAFNYCANMYRYYLTSNGRTSNPIMSAAEYAKYGYSNYGGDCIVMASSFRYLAQACGYYCLQWFGWVGSSTHSWCEINGYVYDPNFTNATNRNGYGFSYGSRGTWRYSKSYQM